MEGQLHGLREKPERGNEDTQQEWEGPDDCRRDQEIRRDFPRTSKPGAREDRRFCSGAHCGKPCHQHPPRGMRDLANSYLSSVTHLPQKQSIVFLAQRRHDPEPVHN